MDTFLNSLVIIAMVGTHILEEVFASYNASGEAGRLRGFRRFFNLEWFRTGKEDFPTSKLKATAFDQVGLFLSLALLALGGILWPVLIWVIVGFITADLIQHVVFSIGRRKYSPGVATSALYFIYVAVFFANPGFWGLGQNPEPGRALGGMALGAAGLAGNYILAWRKVRKWRQRQSASASN